MNEATTFCPFKAQRNIETGHIGFRFLFSADRLFYRLLAYQDSSSYSAKLRFHFLKDTNEVKRVQRIHSLHCHQLIYKGRRGNVLVFGSNIDSYGNEPLGNMLVFGSSMDSHGNEPLENMLVFGSSMDSYGDEPLGNMLVFGSSMDS
jgi:uncharacterized Rmd1/YagE family protein